MVANQTSPGQYNDLALRVCGERAGLEWSGQRPEDPRFAPYGEEARLLARGGHGAFGESRRVSRMPAAHPEGYIEAFANLYRDAAEIIRAHRSGAQVDPARAALAPEVIDGARGVKFVAAAAVASNAAGGAWTPASFWDLGAIGAEHEYPSRRTAWDRPACARAHRRLSN